MNKKFPNRLVYHVVFHDKLYLPILCVIIILFIFVKSVLSFEKPIPPLIPNSQQDCDEFNNQYFLYLRSLEAQREKIVVNIGNEAIVDTGPCCSEWAKEATGVWCKSPISTAQISEKIYCSYLDRDYHYKICIDKINISNKLLDGKNQKNDKLPEWAKGFQNVNDFVKNIGNVMTGKSIIDYGDNVIVESIISNSMTGIEEINSETIKLFDNTSETINDFSKFNDFVNSIQNSQTIDKLPIEHQIIEKIKRNRYVDHQTKKNTRKLNRDRELQQSIEFQKENSKIETFYENQKKQSERMIETYNRPIYQRHEYGQIILQNPNENRKSNADSGRIFRGGYGPRQATQ